MKYQININQLVLAETSLDLLDMAILDYLIFYCNSKSSKVEKQRIVIDGEKYTWVDLKSLLKDMPALRLKTTNSLSPRIQKIASTGYIKTHREGHQKLFVCTTSLVDKLFVETISSNRVDDQLIYDNNTKDNNTKSITNVIEDKSSGNGLILNKKPEFGLPDINEGMTLLKTLYPNTCKTDLNRFALKRLLRKFDKDIIFRRLKYAHKNAELQYIPTIFNYMDLEEKWDKLEAFGKRQITRSSDRLEVYKVR